MKRTADQTSKLAGYLTMALLALVPFHGFLTVWASALVGHYALLRVWDELLFVPIIGIVVFWLARDHALRQWFFGSLLVRLILAYASLTVLLCIVAYAKDAVTPKALFYGLLINLRFLFWFLAVLLTVQRSPWLTRQWPRYVLAPAAVVVIFAVLQYILLPHDFLVHFGYDTATTIAPIETINHNDSYIRVQSTLRGANPLGAYLVIILSVLAALFTRGRRRIICAVFGVLGAFALYASGSRSAWIGMLLSIALLAWLLIRGRRAQLLYAAIGTGFILLAGIGFLMFRHNAGLQNAVLHTQDNSAVATTSNEAHASAVIQGLKDVAHQPLGDGPGTAGPASVYNGPYGGRIAENYYVQIAQEVGWLGLALLLSILVLVGIELYQRAGESTLALALFAAFIGIAFINLLSHAWTDDTLAFLWWGLAAISLGSIKQKAGRSHA
jgi:hypothetical protein